MEQYNIANPWGNKHGQIIITLRLSKNLKHNEHSAKFTDCIPLFFEQGQKNQKSAMERPSE